jgi:hypothetical protein
MNLAIVPRIIVLEAFFGNLPKAFRLEKNFTSDKTAKKAKAKVIC